MDKTTKSGKLIWNTGNYTHTFPELRIGAIIKYRNWTGGHCELELGSKWVSCNLTDILTSGIASIMIEYDSKEIEELYTMGYRDG